MPVPFDPPLDHILIGILSQYGKATLLWCLNANVNNRLHEAAEHEITFRRVICNET